MSRLLVLALGAALPLAAQTNAIIDRANQGAPGSAPPAPAPESAPAAPGADTDAGTQRVAEPRRLPVRLSAYVDEQLYVASNVFLAPKDSPVNDTGALVSVTTVGVGVESLPVVVGSGRLAFSAELLWQRNLHGLATSDPAIEELDFDSYSLPLSASFQWGRGWQAGAGLALGSLYSVRGSPSHELLYRSAAPSLSLRKISRLSEGAAVSAGVGISYSDTWASLHDVPSSPLDLRYRDDRNDRVDASADAALYAFDGPWTFSPSVRLSRAEYLHWQEAGYVDQDRADLTVSLGVSLSYAFSDRGSARAFAAYDIRDSSGGSVDYDYAGGSAGLGLALALRF